MLRPGEIIVDNFAGGGGASAAIEWALGRSPDVAINHDAEAVAMHAANHPATRHYCQSIMSIDPRDATGGRPVGLAWFSPDCKHFSKAKGGRPVEKRIRDLAWIVVHWAEYVRPRIIFLENVEEFRDWGPLTPEGRPCPVQKGLEFRRWVKELKRRGYVVEWRELRACDYGAPTVRKRLFLIARCDGEPIRWPTPTHGPRGVTGLRPYRTAAECIDWSLPCPSIFLTREEVKRLGLRINRPLAPNTMRRIARGVKRFVLDNADPFIVSVAHGDSGGRREYPIGDPLGTLTSERAHAVVSPFAIPLTHTGDARVYNLGEPARTITTAQRGEQALVTPFISRQFGKGVGHCAAAPIGTTTAGGGGKSALVSPFFIPRYGERPGQEPRCQSAEEPIATSLVAAFMAQHNGGMTGHRADRPVSTLTQRGTQQRLVACHLSHQYGSATNGGQGDLRQPLKTVLTGGHHALVAAFLGEYYGEGGQWQDPRAPLNTVTTRDRFKVVTVEIDGQTFVLDDIGMRMLTPRELFRAQGFDEDYIIDPVFKGKPLTQGAQVRMCGNSVSPYPAAALIRANLEGAAAAAAESCGAD